MADQSSTAEAGRPAPVHRLTFDYHGNQVDLVSDQVVNMIIPPTQPLDESATGTGFSVIVRDTADQTLYKSSRPSPIRYDAEVFSDDPSRSLQRVAVEEPRGTFVLLVPHVEGAASVELIGPSRAEDDRVRESRALARFPLRPPQGSR